ncbi:MAG TPA: TlpA disulfide reductase family protein, partial [Candidatus Polarisedimenticolaceae bacterium]|nr:TlpA disulfide reductase family protein [Candidatus Polarisedimenticolaceae bacterium]
RLPPACDQRLPVLMRIGRLALACLGLGLVVAGMQARELWTLWSTPEAVHLRSGDAAPPLRFRTAEGKDQDLESLRGSPVLVTFWASWCVPCRAELPELANVVKEVNAEEGPPVHVLAINTSDEARDAAAVIRDPAYGAFLFGVDGDGSMARAWGASVLPTLVLVRPDGKIAEVREGYDPHMGGRLRGWIKATRRKQAE